jgi:hypothetical protein
MATDSASAYIQASCDGELPAAKDILASVDPDVNLMSLGDGLFALNPADEPKLDASIKVKGVVVRLRT